MSGNASFLRVLGSRAGHADEDKTLELWHYDKDHTPCREGERTQSRALEHLVAGGIRVQPQAGVGNR